MQNFKDIENLSIKLNDTCNAIGITRVLEDIFGSVNIFIFDSTSDTLRDFSKSWISIDEFYKKENTKNLYKIFEELKGNNFIKENSEIFYGLYQGQKLIGMLEFKELLNNDSIEFLKVASYLISLKIQNIILSERMQKNIDFHDAMKNIAKIIETQYETSYIIPIIGEMIDKFVSEHLIYIFIDNKLIWPSACKDEKYLSC